MDYGLQECMILLDEHRHHHGFCGKVIDTCELLHRIQLDLGAF